MIRKRQFVVVAMCLLIVAGAYLTGQQGKQAEPVISQEGAEVSPSPKLYGEAQFVNGDGVDYFSQAKLSRDEARAEALDLLREVTEHTASDAASIEQAVQAMTQMAKSTEQESKIENELKAKGFDDAVVFITDAGVSVTVPSDGLEAEEMAKILSPVMAETGLGADKIKIIEIK